MKFTVFYFSPIAYLDPGNANLTSMFVHLLKDSLNEYAYAAQLAGLRWDITNTKNGIIVSPSFIPIFSLFFIKINQNVEHSNSDVDGTGKNLRKEHVLNK